MTHTFVDQSGFSYFTNLKQEFSLSKRKGTVNKMPSQKAKTLELMNGEVIQEQNSFASSLDDIEAQQGAN